MARSDPSNSNSTLIMGEGGPESLSLAISLTIFAPDCRNYSLYQTFFKSLVVFFSLCEQSV